MKAGMGKIIVVAVLLAAIAGVLALKSRQQGTSAPRETQETRQLSPPAVESTTAEVTPARVNTVPPKKEVTQPASKLLGPEPPPVKPQPPKPVKNPAPAVQQAETPPVSTGAQPRLLELGADKCVPCKMMKPILAELRQEYPGKLQVDFIDVWKEPAASELYGVKAIPTQIFFDAGGKEIFRHTGFYSKDDILARFAEHEIEL